MERYLTDVEPDNKTHNVAEYTRRSWVESPRDPKGPCWRHEMHWRFVDGTEATLSGNHFFGEVLPANPGFEMIYVDEDFTKEEPVVLRQPIIAWRHIPYGSGIDNEIDELEPLVQSPSPAKALFACGVLQPDGRVFSRGRWYENESAFVKAHKPEWHKKKEYLSLEERHKDCPFCAEIRRRDDDFPFDE